MEGRSELTLRCFRRSKGLNFEKKKVGGYIKGEERLMGDIGHEIFWQPRQVNEAQVGALVMRNREIELAKNF